MTNRGHQALTKAADGIAAREVREVRSGGVQCGSRELVGEAQLRLLREALLASLQADKADLTMRQLAIFLTVYTTPRRYSIGSLTAALQVDQPTISYAVDRLERDSLARRTAHPGDKRIVLVAQTPQGSAWLGSIQQTMVEACAALEAARTEVTCDDAFGVPLLRLSRGAY